MRIGYFFTLLTIILNPAFQSEAVAASAQSFPKAELYRPVGTETEKTKGDIQVDQDGRILRFLAEKHQEPLLEIDYSKIQKITYEKSKKPRYAAAILVSPLFLFSRSKRHWITVEYKDGEEAKTVLIRLDKSNFEQVIKGVEQATGIKVQYSAAIE